MNVLVPCRRTRPAAGASAPEQLVPEGQDSLIPTFLVGTA